MLGGFHINYSVNNWPAWLYLSQGGALLGVPEDGEARWFLPVRVMDNFGLFHDETFSLHINGTSGSEQIEAQSKINIYPNPFSDRLNISLDNISGDDLHIDLYTIDGKMVYTKEISTASGNISLDLSGLVGRGSFFYQIAAGGTNYRGKLVRY